MISSFILACALMVSIGLVGAPQIHAWRFSFRSSPVVPKSLVDQVHACCDALGTERFEVRVTDLPIGDALFIRDGRILLGRLFVAKYEADEITEDEAYFVIARSIGMFALSYNQWGVAAGRCGAVPALIASAAIALRLRSPLKLALVYGAAALHVRKLHEQSLEADAFAVQLMDRIEADIFAAMVYVAKSRKWQAGRRKRAPRDGGGGDQGGWCDALHEERMAWIKAVVLATMTDRAGRSRCAQS